MMNRIIILTSFLFTILISYAGGSPASGPSICPVGTIDVVDNGNGNFTFTLNLDYTNATVTSITDLSWDFGDGTITSVSSSQLTISHQYMVTNSMVFSVQATFENQTAGCSSTVEESVNVPDVNVIPNCPVAIFVPIEASDWCNTGELTVHWVFCDLLSGYWVPDHVDWMLSNGTIVTTLGIDPASFTFNSTATVTITAIAYFTGQNGETCSTTILYTDSENDPLANNDPCGDTSTGTAVNGVSYLSVDPFYAQPSLYVDATTYCQMDLISFFDAGGAFPTVGNGWSYEVFVNGSSVASGNGLPNGSSSFFQATLPSGDHQVELVYTYLNATGDSCSVADGLLVTVDSCIVEPCELCTNFRPEPGKRYWLSAWVKESHFTQVKTYQDSYVELEFIGNGQIVQLRTTGEIIEGWQRVVGSFTIPVGTTDLYIHLVNDTDLDAFFDDVRVHPFNASMKSYVYDPETLVLSAELDDNNYATFYEYDKELQLIRIKKETSRGIMTIQESRSSNPKSE